MKRIFIALTLFFTGSFIFSADIIVFAAASTTDLMEEAGSVFSTVTGHTVRLNPASSGTLARQLEQGAFADVYVSASAKWMDYTESLELLDDSSVIMSNSLVLIVPADSDMENFKISGKQPFPRIIERLSIADPAHAPAGKYAVEALKSCGWFDQLEDSILAGADVRRALSVVEFGEADMGVVYRTDAEKTEKVRIAAVFPENTHSAIKYYCGLTAEASEAGAEFYRFLTEDARAASIISKYGFILPQEGE